MKTLKLTYPSQNPGTHLLVNTDLDDLSHWLESLPSGNMEKYVPKVRDAIANLNRTELPINHRLQLLKVMDVAYEKIHNYYRPLMQSGPFKGKHAPQEQLSELNRLTTEMSFGYKMAVSGLASKRMFFRKNYDLSAAINMALHYLGLMLLESYELYQPIPKHVWSEIYQLYHYAEQKEISEEEVQTEHSQKAIPIIEFTFLRNCLLSLANPYHLQRGDHWEVFKYLCHWAQLTVLSDDSDDFKEQHCFVIDLNQDEKPIALKELPDAIQHPMQRFVLTEEMINNIDYQIEQINQTRTSLENCFSRNVIARKGLHILDDLKASWEMKQELQSQRYPDINKMEVIWGLDNVHKVLSLLDPLNPYGSELSAEENQHTTKTLIERNWATVNNSNGGICIGDPDEKVRDLDVGKIVALRENVKNKENPVPQTWQLGIICWITGSARNGTRVGIQFLRGEIQPVQLQARKGNKLETRYKQALLLSGEVINGLSTPTLLTAPGLYVEARPLRMQIGDEVQNIHARTKVNSSITVDRFFYQQDFQSLDEVEVDLKQKAKDEGVDEIINLSSTPGPYERPIDDETIKKAKPDPTLDDVILKKN